MMRSRGFTLIEVLVALAIVTIGMAALLSALSSSADSSAYLRDKTFAEWVALNRIEEVRLATQLPEKKKSDGTAELAGRKWKWQQEVQETTVAGILRVDVRVKPDEIAGDSNWYAEVSGIRANTLSNPSGIIDYFAKPPSNPGGPPGGQGGNPSTNNGAGTNTGPGTGNNNNNNNNNAGNNNTGTAPQPPVAD
jgi:general secretion pathway protein I